MCISDGASVSGQSPVISKPLHPFVCFTSNILEPDENLPNETLVHIFSFLSQDDLTKVALVSHRFSAIAERVLYSSIDIDEGVTEDS